MFLSVVYKYVQSCIDVKYVCISLFVSMFQEVDVNSGLLLSMLTFCAGLTSFNDVLKTHVSTHSFVTQVLF